MAFPAKVRCLGARLEGDGVADVPIKSEARPPRVSATKEMQSIPRSGSYACLYAASGLHLLKGLNWPWVYAALGSVAGVASYECTEG